MSGSRASAQRGLSSGEADGCEAECMEVHGGAAGISLIITGAVFALSNI